MPTSAGSMEDSTSVQLGLGSYFNIPPLLTWEIEAGNIPPVMTNGITLDQMREKLADARARLDSVKREVAAWEQVVAVEEAKIGIERLNPVSPNKSEILRQFMRASRKQGVTYKSIREHYDSKGVPMGSNFIYNLIDKWEAKGDVEKRDNRIFWKGD